MSDDFTSAMTGKISSKGAASVVLQQRDEDIFHRRGPAADTTTSTTTTTLVADFKLLNANATCNLSSATTTALAADGVSTVQECANLCLANSSCYNASWEK